MFSVISVEVWLSQKLHENAYYELPNEKINLITVRELRNTTLINNW